MSNDEKFVKDATFAATAKALGFGRAVAENFIAESKGRLAPKERPTIDQLLAPVLKILRKTYQQRTGALKGFKFDGLHVPSSTMTIDETFFSAENIAYHKERGRDVLCMALLVVHAQGRMLGEQEERKRNEELEEAQAMIWVLKINTPAGVRFMNERTMPVNNPRLAMRFKTKRAAEQQIKDLAGSGIEKALEAVSLEAAAKVEPCLSIISPLSCAVREFSGDDVSVGRCYHFVGDKDICPRHGDVAEIMKLYRETGKLTDDPSRKKRK